MEASLAMQSHVVVDESRSPVTDRRPYCNRLPLRRINITTLTFYSQNTGEPRSPLKLGATSRQRPQAKIPGTIAEGVNLQLILKCY